MAHLNYHHLYYFYIIAREGSIVSAAEILNLTPQTVSGQLSTLEDYFGVKLFDRVGKRLILNEVGNMTLGYAEDIFALGGELTHSLKNHRPGRNLTFSIGVTDVIPKVFAFDLIKTCFELDDALHLVCKESDLDSLLGELALNRIDLILSDRPLTPGSRIRAYNHLLGESGLTFYGDAKTAENLKPGFPKSLDGQRFLIVGEKSTQKINLLSWFEELKITPVIVAEFDDSALMKFFGQSAYGIFCTPTTIEQHVVELYNVSVIGRTDDIKERFYAVSPERKLAHPAVIHLFSVAKEMLEN